MFDLWSIEHFINGIAMAGAASLIIKTAFKKIELNEKSRKLVSFLLVLVVALLWECLEHYLESGLLPGEIGERVAYWFYGVEHWSNRLIGDTLTVMLGWRVYQWKPKLALPAKIVSLVWVLVHIFAFPHSMYLHNLLFG
ncbi:MAG: hypothetical protein FWD88_07815 [Treponema sp.]|nr:hypothetical protein [Treponema sp.]